MRHPRILCWEIEADAGASLQLALRQSANPINAFKAHIQEREVPILSHFEFEFVLNVSKAGRAKNPCL
jgi:hypothetical protein